jgi:hypothetical protein
MTERNDDFQDLRRSDFLMRMYSEMWGNINRHLTVVWQSVGVLGAGLALFALTEKHVVGPDFASAVMVLVCFWLIANAYVSSQWFNRNQAILSNIERQFLRREDLREINPYFLKHREPGDMVSHIRVQWFLGVVLASAVITRHFFVEILPTAHWSTNVRDLDWGKLTPYAAFLAGCIAVKKVRDDVAKGEKRFQEECPGKDIGEKATPPRPS